MLAVASSQPARPLRSATTRLPTRRLAARPLPRARRAAPICLAARRGAVDLLLDKVPGEGAVLSAKLNPDVRQRAEQGAPASDLEARPPASCALPYCRPCSIQRLPPLQPSRRVAGGLQWATWLPPRACAWTRPRARCGRWQPTQLRRSRCEQEADAPPVQPAGLPCCCSQKAVNQSSWGRLGHRPSPRLQVASDGEIVWVFPPGFEATIAGKSWRLRAEPVLKGEQTAQLQWGCQ